MIRAWCFGGGHEGPEDPDLLKRAIDRARGPSGIVRLPPEWRLVRARKVGNKWVHDPGSPAEVTVCPKHKLEGEP